MPFNDHEGFSFTSHLGLFDRGEQDSVPAEHFVQATNIIFQHKSWGTRPGFDDLVSFNPATPPLRVHLYQRVNESPRYLWLDGSGNLRDSTTMPAVLVNVPTAVDFSCISLFNRAYITFHDRITGLAGSSIYMYDGTNIRLAAGLAPINGAPPYSITNGAVAAPKISKGIHLFSVAYEFDTGFITKPGPTVVWKALGNRKVNINNIPIGPTGVVARHILVTKAIKVYDGNPSNYELFFLQKVNDNVTANLVNVGFLDSSLVNSADYLLDLLETIPAGVALAEYQGSLVSVGENGKESVFRVSLAGQPESFNAVDGFGICYPGDGGGLRNVKEYRGNLYLFKVNRTFSTRSNGDSPSTWSVILIDAAVGTGCFGLSQILDSSGDSRDNMLLASTAGMMQFYGRYTDKPLSWKIENVWLSLINVNQSQICIDPDLKRVYSINGSDGNIIVGDLSNGLSPDDVRWSVWKLSSDSADPNNFFSITDIIFSSDGLVIAKPDKLMVLNETATSDALPNEASGRIQILTVVQFPFVSNPNAAVAHHNGFRAQIRGEGNLQSEIIGTDGILILPNQNLTVDLFPSKDYFRQFNLVSERGSMKFLMFDNTNLGYIVACMECTHFAEIIWETRPA